MATEGLVPYITGEKEVDFIPSNTESEPFYIVPSDFNVKEFEKQYWRTTK